MAVGDLLSGPFQVELRDVLMDACACEGLIVTEWLDGFGVPATRDNDQPRPQRDGLFASPQYLGGRAMLLGVAALADSTTELMALMEDLGTAFGPVSDTDSDLVIEMAFTLADAGQKYLVRGKPQRAATGYKTVARIWRRTPRPFTESALCEFLATDPLIYDADAGSASSGFGSSSGGLAFPFAFPFAFGSATPGAVTVSNEGNARTYPTFTFQAGASGLSGIIVTNNLTGDQWGIALTLGAADSLVVDMDAHTVLLNGTADRASFVTRPPSVWLYADPGDTTFSWVGTGAGSTMTVSWRSAWLL